MKTALLFAASLLLPASLFADVAINVRFSTGDFTIASSAHTMNDYDDNAYISVDEPWFEDIECSGNARVSYEYQWTNWHGNYVLVYRRVNFRPYNANWTFGPWLVRSGISYATHQRRRPVSSSSWIRCRSRNHGAVSYYYEYREPRYQHAAPRVYRHNYKQPHRAAPKHVSKKRRYNHSSSPAPVKRSSTTLRRSRERAPVIAKKQQKSRKSTSMRGRNNNTVVRVTERKRIR